MSHAPSTASASDSPDSTYFFGDFRLASNPHHLSRHHERITLQPQPARLLTLLIQRRGEIVSRDEIRRELWPEGGFLDHEQAINFAVRKIRVALDDSAKEPSFIETVPRLGYRFVAAVDVGSEAAGEGSATPPPARTAVTTHPGESLGRWMAELSPQIPWADSDEKLLAPVPRPRGAEAVDATSPQPPGEMPDAPFDSPPPSSELHDTSSSLTFVMLIALAVLLMLVPIGVGHEIFSASPGKDSPLKPLGSSGPSALSEAQAEEAYLQGRFLVEKGSPEETQLGISKLREAVFLNPSSAKAHLALAFTFNSLNKKGQHFSSFMPDVEEKATRALELNPNLQGAHFLRSVVLFSYRQKWREAEAAARRAIEIGGDYSSEALGQLAMILAAKGHTSEAVELMQRAVSSDPAKLYVCSRLVLVLMYDRRYAEALEVSQGHLEVDPTNRKNLFLEATLRQRLGDRAGALAAFRAYFESWEEPPPESVEEAFDRLIDRGEERRSQGRRAHLPLAMMHALIDNPEKALENLIEACDRDPHWELPMVGVDPRFDSVRKLPGYARLEGCLPPRMTD